MKKFKKVLALALALALALSLSMPVFAADDPENPGTGDGNTPPVVAPINPDKYPDLPEAETGDKVAEEMAKHVFTAFQIFKGEQDGESLELGQIEWGTGINENEFMEKLVVAFPDDIKEGMTAAEVAAVVSGWADNKTELTTDANVLKFAQLADECTKGYGTAAGSELTAGYYLIRDAGYDPAGEPLTYNVSFLTMNTMGAFTPNIKADLPKVDKSVWETNDSQAGNDGWKDHADYDVDDNIPYVLTGTLPTNYAAYETYKYAFVDTLSTGLTYDGNAKVYVENAGQLVDVTDSFAITFEDQTLTVSIDDLKTIKNENDEPLVSITSVIRVFYSATLNENAVIGGAGNDNTVHLEFSNNPNFRGEGEPPTGTTPDDKVTVFTFKLVADKVDENNEALEGAEFTLYKKTGTDEEGNPVYTEVATLQGTGDNKNQFNFTGLDAGDYKLEESKVPGGYNKADDIEFRVVAEEGIPEGKTEPEVISLEIQIKGENGTYAKAEDGYTIEVKAGTISTNIVNLRGLLLPSTGGIGTTIFYTVGGLLVVAAVVLLITKKRMGKTE